MKSKNLHDLRLKYRNDELSDTSSRSYLSKNSSRYLKDKDYKPPCKKVKDVLTHKRQSICNIQEKISKEKAIKNPEPSFHPTISESHTNRRTKEKFYKEMMDWMKHKRENQVLKELEVKQNESQKLTFSPEINYNSNQIANELDRGKCVEDRLNNWKKKIEEKKKLLVKSVTPDFKPKISEYSEALVLSHREKMKRKQEENKEEEESLERHEENRNESPKKNPSVSFNLENNTIEEIEKQEPEYMQEILQEYEDYKTKADEVKRSSIGESVVVSEIL